MKSALINTAISFLLFAFVFYSFAGDSGGDMAILFGSIFFGFLQIIAVTINCYFKNQKSGKILLAIIIAQIIQIFIFVQWGYSINEWLKQIKH